MNWNAFHRRGEILAAVVETADRRLDGQLPTDVPGVAETFADDADLVGALSLKWHARLSGNIERALAVEPMDLPAAVATAWRRTAQAMPGVRLVLDRATDHPHTEQLAAATHRARRAERARLAQAAGLAQGVTEPAVSAGAAIEARARADLAAAARPTRVVRDRESFVERIKAVLAA